MTTRRLLAFCLICLCAACSGRGGALPAAAPQGTPAAKSGIIRYVDLDNYDVRDVPMQLALRALTEQGYTVEPNYLSTSTLVVEVLAAGDADLGWVNDQAAWAAIGEGADLRTVMQTSATTAVMAARQEIENCEQLAGRPVATPGGSGATTSLSLRYFEEHCPDAQPLILMIGEPVGRIAALEAGEVDAALVQSEQLLKLERELPGQFHGLFYLATEFPNVQIDGLQVRRAWAEQNPEIVKDFIRALLEAHRRVKAEPQVLYDEAAKWLELDPAVAQEIGESHLANGVWDANGSLTEAKVQDSLDFYVDIETLPPGQTVADLSYLDTVLDEIGRQ